MPEPIVTQYPLTDLVCAARFAHSCSTPPANPPLDTSRAKWVADVRGEPLGPIIEPIDTRNPGAGESPAPAEDVRDV